MKDIVLLVGNPGLWGLKQLVDKTFGSTPEGAPKQSEAVKEEEIQRVMSLIERGRRQGVEQIEIEISSGLASQLKGEAAVPLEGMPVSASCAVSRDGNGKYVMKVSYLPLTVTDKLRELGGLHKEGLLTAEEFSQAKAELIKQL